MRTRNAVLVCLFGCTFLSLDTLAHGFYGGLEISRERQRFNPHYFMPDGTPDDDYTNRASGTAGAVFAGHRWSVAPSFSLALEARLALSDTRWRLSIPAEPASLRYDIPFSAGITAQPTFHVSERISLYAEGGIAYGRIRQQKQGSPAGNYDERRWRSGAILGVGMNLDLGEAWGMRLGYRETRYREMRYAARDGAGSLVESIRDKPRQTNWHLGIFRSF